MPLPPEPTAYAIAAGLRARSIVPSILGMITGYVVVVVAVAVGVGALVTRIPAALTALTVTGASYLVYLGIAALVSRAARIAASAINSKGLLLLLALLPQFTALDGWPSPLQMLTLGGLHVLNCAIVYFAVAALARRILRSRPRATTIVTKAAGVIMVLIGGGILVEQLLTSWHKYQAIWRFARLTEELGPRRASPRPRREYAPPLPEFMERPSNWRVDCGPGMWHAIRCSRVSHPQARSPAPQGSSETATGRTPGGQ